MPWIKGSRGRGTCPPLPSFPSQTDVPVLGMSDTEYYTMEADRRPHAARRSTVLNPAAGRRLPVHVASVPATETAYFAMERRRRPAAAVRQGFVVKKPSLPVHVAFEANKLGAAAIDSKLYDENGPQYDAFPILR